MTDDKNNTGYQDRAQVSGDQEYEVGYFASKFGLSTPQVRELIAKHGNNRETLERDGRCRSIGSELWTRAEVSTNSV